MESVLGQFFELVKLLYNSVTSIFSFEKHFFDRLVLELKIPWFWVTMLSFGISITDASRTLHGLVVKDF